MPCNLIESGGLLWRIPLLFTLALKTARPAMAGESDRNRVPVPLATVKADCSFFNPPRAADGATVLASQIDKLYGLWITA